MNSIKRLYIDVCTLCRPFDDQNQMRIRLETDAWFLILNAIKQGGYEMAVSPVHTQEITAISEAQERYELLSLLSRYGLVESCDHKVVRVRAEELCRLRFGVADAAHVTYAEVLADAFISCDDKLLKKCRTHKLKIPAMNPVEFCTYEDLT